MSEGIHVATTVNGDAVEYVCSPRETLLDVLRNRLGLTGAKEGCGTGDCGACSVTVDGRLVCSCLVLGAEADGREVTTVEGLSIGGKLHPLQTQVHRTRGAAVRHLHAGLSGCGEGVARPQPRPERRRDPLRAGRQPVPLHRIRQDRPRGERGGEGNQESNANR